MLMFARIVAVLTAVIAVANIAVGAMTDPDFLIPDLVLSAGLIIAGLLPSARDAAVALVAALAFALGVFGVAVGVQWNAGEANWPLIALMVADAAALVSAGIVLRRRTPAP